MLYVNSDYFCVKILQKLKRQNPDIYMYVYVYVYAYVYVYVYVYM